MTDLGTHGKQKQPIKSRGEVIEGERRRGETGAGESQLDGDTEIDANLVTHHWKRSRTHKHEQPSIMITCKQTHTLIFLHLIALREEHCIDS